MWPCSSLCRRRCACVAHLHRVATACECVGRPRRCQAWRRPRQARRRWASTCARRAPLTLGVCITHNDVMPTAQVFDSGVPHSRPSGKLMATLIALQMPCLIGVIHEWITRKTGIGTNDFRDNAICFYVPVSINCDSFEVILLRNVAYIGCSRSGSFSRLRFSVRNEVNIERKWHESVEKWINEAIMV